MFMLAYGESNNRCVGVAVVGYVYGSRVSLFLRVDESKHSTGRPLEPQDFGSYITSSVALLDVS